MKRERLLKVTLLLVLIFSLGSMECEAKKIAQFGLRGGLNLTNMTFNSNPLVKENQAGFYVGPTFKFMVPIVGVGLDISGLYNQKGCKIGEAFYEEQTLTQKSIALPINVRFEFGLGSIASIFLKAGPQFDFNVGDKDFKWLDGSSYKLKDSNFSVNVGVGVFLMDHLEVSGNYNIACSKTGEGFWENTLEGFKEFDSHSNVWQIGVAYYF